jgi:hypothetical protein
VVKTFFKHTSVSVLALALSATFAVTQPRAALAQAATVNVSGHVNNAIGQPITKGEVKFSTDKTSAAKDRKYEYTFPLDGNGDYKGTGIKPGDYIVIVWVDAKSVDYQDLTVKAGPDVTANFDMTREAYIKALTPEERAQI